MLQVLFNCIAWIALLAVVCLVLVKVRGGSALSLKRLQTVVRGTPGAKTQPLPPAIEVRQRAFLGWKSSLVDVAWNDRRYLLVLQEGRCTLVDSMPAQEASSQHENE